MVTGGTFFEELGFYYVGEVEQAFRDGLQFLQQSQGSKRAIIRIELYNPQGEGKR